jgi:hypothetical protein
MKDYAYKKSANIEGKKVNVYYIKKFLNGDQEVKT